MRNLRYGRLIQLSPAAQVFGQECPKYVSAGQVFGRECSKYVSGHDGDRVVGAVALAPSQGRLLLRT